MTEIDTGDAFRTSGTSKLHAIPKYAEVQNDPGVLKTFNDNVVEEFRANGGKVGGPYEGTDIVLLTMTGAKSGQPRSTPLEYFTIAGRIVLVGSYGGAPKDPAWVHNLRANPRAHVEIGEDSYDVIAHELSRDERDALFAAVVDVAPRVDEHQAKIARVVPIFELQKAQPLPHSVGRVDAAAIGAYFSMLPASTVIVRMMEPPCEISCGTAALMGLQTPDRVTSTRSRHPWRNAGSAERVIDERVGQTP